MLYQFSDYKIETPFINPTFEVFNNWRLDFISNSNLDEYNILFMGNSAERFFGQSQLPTLDIDVVIYNKKINYEEISNILHSAFQIGLKYNILIDIYFVDVDVFKHKNFGSYYAIRFYKEMYLNGKYFKVWKTEKVDELPYGLWGASRIESETTAYKKYINRINEGHYLGLKFDLKTLNLISYN